MPICTPSLFRYLKMPIFRAAKPFAAHFSYRNNPFSFLTVFRHQKMPIFRSRMRVSALQIIYRNTERIGGCRSPPMRFSPPLFRDRKEKRATIGSSLGALPRCYAASHWGCRPRPRHSPCGRSRSVEGHNRPALQASIFRVSPSRVKG